MLPTDHRRLPTTVSPPLLPVTFYEFYNKDLNLSVISVVGTNPDNIFDGAFVLSGWKMCDVP